MLRVYAAYAFEDTGAVLPYYSRQEGVLVIGTDPNEWWAGFDTLARIYKTQFRMLRYVENS